jgi:hypothetical protein
VEIFAADRLVDENTRGDLRRRFPYLLLFGSDGSREYLAYDLREQPPPVVMVEITAASPDDFVFQAPAFDEFLEQLPTMGLRFE